MRTACGVLGQVGLSRAMQVRGKEGDVYWLGMDGGACTAPVGVARASSSSSLQDVQRGLLAPDLPCSFQPQGEKLPK